MPLSFRCLNQQSWYYGVQYARNAVKIVTGHMLRHPHIGEKVFRCVEELPNVFLETNIQPITRTILRIKLTITPEFRWNNHVTLQNELYLKNFIQIVIDYLQSSVAYIYIDGLCLH